MPTPYVPIEEAKALGGLRLVLTQGVPGPWSEAAKGILHVKGIPYVRVAQEGGGDNDELVAWTGHANAPTAVYQDEPALAGREEILALAERLAPEPALLPADPALRATVVDLNEAIGGDDGFGWNRRLALLAPMHAQADAPPALAKIRDNLSERYGYSEAAYARATGRCVEILEKLAAQLHRQAEAGSRYFVGDALTATDIYWATFCALAKPLPDDVCPMNGFMRAGYTAQEPEVLAALDDILVAHRDFVYATHLELPLDF